MKKNKKNKFPTLSKLIQADDDIHNDRNHHHRGHKINQICGFYFYFFFVHLCFTDDEIGKKFLKIHKINITMVYEE
mgnify:FL=1